MKENDVEGRRIQTNGVEAIVYTEKLWWDKKAQLALMRLDNLNADIQKGWTQLDAFGHVCQQVSDLIKEFGPDDGDPTISTDDVMRQIAEMGYGSMAENEWQHLVDFRLLLSARQADMLKDCLFQVCNGRVRIATKTYKDIHNLHPTLIVLKVLVEKCFNAAIVALWVPLDEIPPMVFLS